ncbi:T9SS type A sorting domain-containing protein [Mesonia sp. MT50]|uniref:T9SS type A sorting domain-containing protein n=1 Tax=Mesonia profundi TaxID=3070998 RepID=A0ABU1A4C8_9FLAO|nr:T9SS type A sorting domain-containing protein [Mesonia profundi]MDQ7917724.1 T9SS type A sorting domain-containing protein [Mesonia profundi]
MKKIQTVKNYISILGIFLSLGITAQTTSIPDTNFEQYLIIEGIDSDGIVNGQVLTSDIAPVLTLYLYGVSDLTGLEDFTALKEVTIRNGGQPNVNLDIDLTNNSNLEKIDIWEFAGFTNLDVTGLIHLEELSISDVSDAPAVMMIDEVDLSTNINIQKFTAVNLYWVKINLKNGNNHNMTNFDLKVFTAGPEESYPSSFCAEVDNASAATADVAPYNTWLIYGIATYYDQGECMLAADTVNKIEVALYPNPVQNTFQIETSEEIKRVNVFSIAGKEVASFTSQLEYDISNLSSGVYFLKVRSATGENVQQLIKR